MSRTPALVIAIVLALVGCSTTTTTPPPADPNPGNLATAANGWYRGDLHFHTNYSGDAKSQGGDDMAQALAIADAWRDPAWLKQNPEWTGDGLDFVEVSDHRTVDGLSDPDFKSDHLILIPGEEYGGTGHANIIGIQALITNDPVGDETQDAHHQASIAEAHRQGALFSINHPCQDNRWPWSVDGIDGVEVWNAPWTAFWGETSDDDLAAEAQSTGVENPYIGAGVAHHGGGSNDQALWLWYGMLTRGLHPALVGGSDRHMLMAAGLPTTYVHHPADPTFAGKTGKALGYAGLVQGIREGDTFVSSSPHGPQVMLEAVDAAGTSHPMGSALAAGATYRIDYTVTRAKSGLLRLVGGDVVPGTGPVTPAPSTLAEIKLADEVVKGSFTWTVPAGGAWLHAIVLEPREPTPLPSADAQIEQTLSVLPQGKSLGAMITVMGDLMDPTIWLSPQQCDAADWDPDKAECMPIDKTTWATFYVPMPVLRLMNTWFEDGVATPWSLGALSSAFLAK